MSDHYLIYSVLVWIALISAASAFPQVFFFFFFFFSAAMVDPSSVNRHLCTVHGPHKLHFLSTFSLKMGHTALFTHLKIILLQCFQFSVFSFSKISSIQTDPNNSNRFKGKTYEKLFNHSIYRFL